MTALDPTRRFCDLNEELCRRSGLDGHAGSLAERLKAGGRLALLMPDFDERMAGLARNVEEQRVGLIMAVFSRPADSAAG